MILYQFLYYTFKFFNFFFTFPRGFGFGFGFACDLSLSTWAVSFLVFLVRSIRLFNSFSFSWIYQLPQVTETLTYGLFSFVYSLFSAPPPPADIRLLMFPGRGRKRTVLFSVGWRSTSWWNISAVGTKFPVSPRSRLCFLLFCFYFYFKGRCQFTTLVFLSLRGD